MTKKKLPAKDDDLTRELVIDSTARWPEPLDHRIAALMLRTRNNDVTDGYDLTLSATFGQERVTLKAGEIELTARLSIRSADIMLSFVGSDVNPIDTDDLNYSEGWTRTENETTNSRSKRQGKFDLIGHLSATGSARATSSAEASSTHENKAHLQHKQRDWFIQTVDTIRVGRFGKELDGPVVNNVTAWRIIPQTKHARSGVIARIVVREGWISFDKLETAHIPSRLKYKFDELFNASECRRRLFLALLSQLVLRRLQETSDGRDATLAMSALVVKPHEAQTITLLKSPSSAPLQIPPGPIERFLFTEEGSEEKLLLGMGGQKSAADTDSSHSEYLFVPQCTPQRTVAALQALAAAGSMDRAEFESELGRNELRGLVGLKLVEISKSGTVAPIHGDFNCDHAVKRAASRLPAIMAARQMLLSDPNVSRFEIASVVGFAIGKTWANKGTMQRHGNTIRRWVFWLEPHLIIQDSRRMKAMMRVATEKEARGKGEHGVLTPAVKERFVKLYNEGVSTGDLARDFGVTVQAISTWRLKLGLPKRPYIRSSRKSK